MTALSQTRSFTVRQTRSTNGLVQLASAQHPEYCSCPGYKLIVGGNPGFGKGQRSTQLGRLGGDLELVSHIDAADEVHRELDGNGKGARGFRHPLGSLQRVSWVAGNLLTELTSFPCPWPPRQNESALRRRK